MEIYFVVAAAALMLLAAAGLMLSHVYSWRGFQAQESDAEETAFRRRQFRRRMQTSAMLGLLALAVLVGYTLTLRMPSSRFTPIYWIVVMGMACWVGLLAIIDMWATRRYFGRLRHRCTVEQARLQAEIRRIQAVRGNGKAGPKGKELGLKDQKSPSDD